MITFKQFITEEETFPLKETIEKLAGSFLRRSGRNGFLYRGVNTLKNAERSMILQDPDEDYEVKLYVKKTRKDRRPMTLDSKISVIINGWLEDKLGIKGRSEAVFCYGEKGFATTAGYGYQCVIFPIGDFTYAWSPNVEDLYYTSMDHIIGNKEEFQTPGGNLDQAKVIEFMETLGYTMNGLDEAVTKNAEIMIDCDSYALIPIHSIKSKDDHYLNPLRRILGIK